MSQQLPTTEITVKGKAARIRGATWTHDQVTKLFDVWTQPDIYQGLLNEKKKLDIFKNMASILTDRGVNRTWRECRAKIKNLKADFRKAMDKKTPFRYFEEMKSIMNLDGSVPSSSGGTGGGRTIDTYFAPSRSSTPHSSQELQRRQDSGNEADVETSYRSSSPITPERRTPTLHHDDETPSTSRSVIQSVSHHQTQYQQHQHESPSSYHTGVGYLSKDDDDSSSPIRNYTPQPSKQSPYSSTIESQHFPHTSQQYYQKEQHDRYEQGHGWRQLDETDQHYRHHRQLSQSPPHYHVADVEHDSSSRSSMVITHVVSNVIEPVTEVIMPSSSGGIRRNISEDLEIVHESVLQDDRYKQQSTPTPPPIRMEFVLDEENVILQPPRSPVSEDEDLPDVTTGPSTDYTITQVESIPISSSPTTPVTSITFDTTADQTLKTPPSQILRHSRKRIPMKRPTKPSSSKSPSKPTHQSKRKSPIIAPSTSTPVKPVPVDSNKRRRLLETLNRKTVETISDLLTDTSQSLLKELQDAEQRFIQWEEEKRIEERKREESMFTKLIAAMKSSSFVPSSSSTSTGQNETEQATTVASDNETSLLANFSNMSKRINDLVCGEVKQTEESLRQWESKMQRQESRHTEKLFGMIINAIKNSSSSSYMGDED